MDLSIGDTRQIIRYAVQYGATLEQTAYILATAYWETNRTVKPVREAYWLSERWRKANLRYWPWYGRGYVQLTWERNYRRAEDYFKVDLTTDPDVVMETEYAVPILVVGSMEGWFTGKKVSDYINETNKDYYNARRVINGRDKASTIASLALQYEKALRDDSSFRKEEKRWQGR